GGGGRAGGRGPLPRGGARGRHSVATLIPVLAWTSPGGDLAARRQPCPTLIHVWQEAAWQRLWATLDAAWGELPADLSVQLVVERGQPGPVLVEVARHPDDLLVVGAGRRGVLTRMWCAKVGRYCLAHAQCPVLAVPPGLLAQQVGHGLHGWSFRRRALTVDRVLRDGGSVTA